MAAEIEELKRDYEDKLKEVTATEQNPEFKKETSQECETALTSQY